MAKRTLWKVLSEDYSCISEHLRQLAELPREPNGSLAAKMRNEAWPLFQEYPMFFVKVCLPAFGNAFHAHVSIAVRLYEHRSEIPTFEKR